MPQQKSPPLSKSRHWKIFLGYLTKRWDWYFCHCLSYIWAMHSYATRHVWSSIGKKLFWRQGTICQSHCGFFMPLQGTNNVNVDCCPCSMREVANMIWARTTQKSKNWKIFCHHLWTILAQMMKLVGKSTQPDVCVTHYVKEKGSQRKRLVRLTTLRSTNETKSR